MNNEQPLVTKQGDYSPTMHQEMQDRTGLYVSILALVIAALSLGMQLQNDEIMEAKIAAAIAPANEVARTAAQNAKLAEDRANKMAAMLEARGLIKLENH